MKRGQAAMEFLMTYGWALLIVLVAIAVLASFGVFGGKGTYEACIMGVGFSCKDFKIAAPDRIEIRVANGLMDIDEFFVTINPNGRICPGVTGYVASAKLNSITSAPAPWPSPPRSRSRRPSPAPPSRPAPTWSARHPPLSLRPKRRKPFSLRRPFEGEVPRGKDERLSEPAAEHSR